MNCWENECRLVLEGKKKWLGTSFKNVLYSYGLYLQEIYKVLRMFPMWL